MTALAKSLDNLIQRWFDCHPTSDSLPWIQSEPDWPSECELIETKQQGKVRWRPVLRTPVGDFSNIERALDMALHNDIWTLYGRYWSESLPLQHPLGELSLIQVWNEADFEYLQQNIIGHIVTKKTMKQQATVFIATTDEDDCNLVLNNDTGAVWLEYVGKEPHKQIADNLGEFLDQLNVIA